MESINRGRLIRERTPSPSPKPEPKPKPKTQLICVTSQGVRHIRRVRITEEPENNRRDERSRSPSPSRDRFGNQHYRFTNRSGSPDPGATDEEKVMMQVMGFNRFCPSRQIDGGYWTRVGIVLQEKHEEDMNRNHRFDPPDNAH